MERIEELNDRDYADMLEARGKIESAVRKSYRTLPVNAVKGLIRSQDVQMTLLEEIANEFVYGGYSTHPIIQEMAQMVPGDDPDFDEDIWDYNWSLVYKLAIGHLSCLLHGIMIEHNIHFEYFMLLGKEIQCGENNTQETK